MTYLVDRLAELRRYLRHLQALAPRVTSSEALTRDLSLHNDVMFSLLMTAQLVIDIAGGVPGFRNVVIHEYAALDLQRVVEALHTLEPIERFMRIVADNEVTG